MNYPSRSPYPNQTNPRGSLLSPAEPAGGEAPAEAGAEPAAEETAAPASLASGGEAPAEPVTDEPAKPEGEEPTEEPAKPDETAFNVTAPEGFEKLDAEALAASTPLLRELGVTDDAKAQEVINKFAPVVQSMVERAVTGYGEQIAADIAATRAQWAKDAANDPEIGGTPEKFAATQADVARARDVFATPELIKVWDETGIGNHPEFLRMLAKVGRSVGEGAVHTATEGGAKAPRTAEQVMYGDEFQPKPAA